MLCSSMHNQNVRVPSPTVWKVRLTVQERHPLPLYADLSVQSQLGTTTECCKSSMWKDLLFVGEASFHSKGNMPVWQQGSIARSISKVVLPTSPTVRSLTSMFLETKGGPILSVLQYKQGASQATEFKTPSFLQTPVFHFILFPLTVLTVHTGVIGNRTLFYSHPARDSISPSQLTAVIFLCQPPLPSHNKQWTDSLQENVRGCLLLNSNSYEIAITITFDISSSF